MIDQLKPGGDIRRDWKTTNKVIAANAALRNKVAELAGAIADLRAAKYRTTPSQSFRIKSVQGDYLTCRTWDGTAEGNTDILVAKSYKLRNSISKETIDGTTYYYTYPSVVHRVSDDGADTEDQFVVPRWLPDDLIWATPTLTFVSVADTPLVWLDDNRDGRAWATDPDYATP